jgi:D-alanyl-D-alanine carboxypeptidase
MSRGVVIAAAVATVLVGLALPAAATAGARDDARLQRGLDALVRARLGPPGAIATLRRDGKTTVLRAGYADRAAKRRPRARDHMRIASVAKAFSGAVALRLVRDGRLGLDDTIAQHRPDLPVAWSGVTVRQLLGHTSGVPDYTKSEGFAKQFQRAPKAYVSPAKIISWVAARRLVFRPGSRYEYSNTDNIVIGLIAEKVTGQAYGTLLREYVFGPLGLSRTSFPTGVALPRPFIHGYVTAPREHPQDVSTVLSPSGAWASGAIVSTPLDLSTFMRGYVSGRLFGTAARREQRRFVAGGQSSPPGPGANSAGLAIFRYRSRCGTVYGHTGNFPGYVQWAAASSDGQRVVTTSLNIPAPEGALLRRLRAVQADAVCALLRR